MLWNIFAFYRERSFFKNNFKLWKIEKLEYTKIYRVHIMCKNSKYSKYNIHGIEKNKINLYLNFTSLNRISNLRKHSQSNDYFDYPILIFYIIFDRVIITWNILKEWLSARIKDYFKWIWYRITYKLLLLFFFFNIMV